MRAGSASVLLVSLVLAPLGCGRRDAPAPPAPPPAETAAAPPTACRPAEGRCVSDDEGEVCRADGSGWDKRTCEKGTVCLAGRCPSLSTPTSRREVLDRKRLLAVAGDGTLDAWAVAAPLSQRTVQRFQEAPADPFSDGAVSTWKSHCAPDGVVSVLGKPDQRQNPPAYALLAGFLIVPENRQVQLKAGAAGRLSVWLNGTSVLEATGPGGTRPLRDEVIALADLNEGVNAITLVVEQPDDHAPAFVLRVHDLKNQPLRDAVFATLVPDARCTAEELLSTTPVLSAGPRGFEVELSPRYVGLVPREVASGGLDVRVELRKEAGKTVAQVASQKLGGADLAGAGARLGFSVAPPDPGKYELAVLGPGGAEVRKVPLSYLGELHERIAKLRARAADAPRWSVPEASRDSFVHHVDRLARALADGEQDRSWLERMTTDAEKIGAALAGGDDAYRTKTGYVYRAYRSKLDGQLQPYVAWVPPSHKPDGKPMPLVLAFHGRDRLPEHALRTVVGHAPDDTMTLSWAAHHLPGLGDLGLLIAAPWSYGNAGPKGMGEDDALRVLDDMKKAYRIDERKVSVTGYSLGGTVSFVLPLHYPDLFSAAAPLCGYPNLTTYESVRTVRHTPWEDALIARKYIVNYAENGLHLPLHIVHGGQDGPGRSQVVADRYRDLGYTRVFDVQDDLDHNVWDYAYEEGKMLMWLKARKRPALPERVRLVTADYRYDRSYWVRLLDMRESLKFAEIDATWSEKEQLLTVVTSNVAELSLDVGVLSPKEGARVTVDGVETPLAPGDTTVYFERSSGAWRRAAEARPRAGHKRHGVSGPLDDVQRHTALVVYGTQDAAQTDANRMTAEWMAAYDTFAAGRLPIKPDVEVGEAELRGRSLVLIGNPASNKVTAALIAPLPVRFEPGAVVVRGKRHEGEEVGVSLIHPNPRDPEEYVVLHAGVGYLGTLAARHLPQLAPDYLVYDRRITVQRGDLLLDRRVVLDGGFFGDDWK